MNLPWGNIWSLGDVLLIKPQTTTPNSSAIVSLDYLA